MLNNKLLYIPLSLAVLACIIYISLALNRYSNMFGFLTLIISAVVAGLLMAILAYMRYKDKLDFENLYALVGMTTLWGLVVAFTFLSIIDWQYATNRCEIASYKIVNYQGRYTSGYGNIKKGKPQANQWLMDVQIDGQVERFVIEKDISTDNRVTTVMDLEFCHGMLGTKYLKLD